MYFNSLPLPLLPPLLPFVLEAKTQGKVAVPRTMTDKKIFATIYPPPAMPEARRIAVANGVCFVHRST